jgi:hypothetical protein
MVDWVRDGEQMLHSPGFASPNGGFATSRHFRRRATSTVPLCPSDHPPGPSARSRPSPDLKSGRTFHNVLKGQIRPRPLAQQMLDKMRHSAASPHRARKALMKLCASAGSTVRGASAAATLSAM